MVNSSLSQAVSIRYSAAEGCRNAKEEDLWKFSGKKEEMKVNVTNNPAGIKNLGQESTGDK